MATLEQLAKSGQHLQYTQQSKNVYVPKTSARAARSDSLARDILNLGKSASGLKTIVDTNNEVSHDGIKRMAEDAAVNLSLELASMDASKDPNTDRNGMVSTANEAFVNGYQTFDDPEAQRVFDSIYTNPGKLAVTKQSGVWNREGLAIGKANLQEHTKANINAYASSITGITAEQREVMYEKYDQYDMDRYGIDAEIISAMSKKAEAEVNEMPTVFLDEKGSPDRNIMAGFFNSKFNLYGTMDENGTIEYRTEDVRIKSALSNYATIFQGQIDNHGKQMVANLNEEAKSWATLNTSPTPSTGSFMPNEQFFAEYDRLFSGKVSPATDRFIQNMRIEATQKGTDLLYNRLAAEGAEYNHAPKWVRDSQVYKIDMERKFSKHISLFANAKTEPEKASHLENLKRMVRSQNVDHLIKDSISQIAGAQSPEAMKSISDNLGFMLTSPEGLDAIARLSGSSKTYDTAMVKLAYYQKTGAIYVEGENEIMETDDGQDYARMLNTSGSNSEFNVRMVQSLKKAGLGDMADSYMDTYRKASPNIGSMQLELNPQTSQLYSGIPLEGTKLEGVDGSFLQDNLEGYVRSELSRAMRTGGIDKDSYTDLYNGAFLQRVDDEGLWYIVKSKNDPLMTGQISINLEGMKEYADNAAAELDVIEGGL